MGWSHRSNYMFFGWTLDFNTVREALGLGEYHDISEEVNEETMKMIEQDPLAYPRTWEDFYNRMRAHERLHLDEDGYHDNNVVVDNEEICGYDVAYNQDAEEGYANLSVYCIPFISLYGQFVSEWEPTTFSPRELVKIEENITSKEIEKARFWGNVHKFEPKGEPQWHVVPWFSYY